MNSDFGANPMNQRNMMGFMFEAFLQNQIDSVVKHRTMGSQMLPSISGYPDLLRPNIGGEPLQTSEPI